MPEYYFALAYAGIPFIEDRSAELRQHVDEKTQTTVRYRPLPDLIDEIDRIMPFRYGKEFSYPSATLGRNLSAIAARLEPGNDFNPDIKIGDWYYPPTASRWS